MGYSYYILIKYGGKVRIFGMAKSGILLGFTCGIYWFGGLLCLDVHFIKNINYFSFIFDILTVTCVRFDKKTKHCYCLS